MNEAKLIDAAYKARRALIRYHITSLRHSIAQAKASDLYNEARKRNTETMEAECHLHNVSQEGIPVIYDVPIGGDNKEAKKRIAELAAMLNGPQFTVQFDAESLHKGLKEMGERLNIESVGVGVDKELVVGKEPKLLNNPDMSPWDSTTE